MTHLQHLQPARAKTFIEASHRSRPGGPVFGLKTAIEMADCRSAHLAFSAVITVTSGHGDFTTHRLPRTLGAAPPLGVSGPGPGAPRYACARARTTHSGRRPDQLTAGGGVSSPFTRSTWSPFRGRLRAAVEASENGARVSSLSYASCIPRSGRRRRQGHRTCMADGRSTANCSGRRFLSIATIPQALVLGLFPQVRSQ